MPLSAAIVRGGVKTRVGGGVSVNKGSDRCRAPALGWRNDSRGGGTRPWGPSRRRVPKCLKGPKTTYTTIAIAEKQSKRSKQFRDLLGPPGPTQELK